MAQNLRVTIIIMCFSTVIYHADDWMQASAWAVASVCCVLSTIVSTPEGDDLVERVAKLERAIIAVVEATRAYLPPDGIDAQECLSRVLGATDNAEINPLILRIEQSK